MDTSAGTLVGATSRKSYGSDSTRIMRLFGAAPQHFCWYLKADIFGQINVILKDFLRLQLVIG
jgi:hypothetical protein